MKDENINVDAMFDKIADEAVASEANDLLEKHIARCIEWAAMRRADDLPVSLRDLIKQLHRERNQRGPILAAYSTALWRILEQRGVV